MRSAERGQDRLRQPVAGCIEISSRRRHPAGRAVPQAQSADQRGAALSTASRLQRGTTSTTKAAPCTKKRRSTCSTWRLSAASNSCSPSTTKAGGCKCRGLSSKACTSSPTNASTALPKPGGPTGLRSTSAARCVRGRQQAQQRAHLAAVSCTRIGPARACALHQVRLAK